MLSTKTSSSSSAAATSATSPTPSAKFGRARQFGSLSSQHSTLPLKEHATQAFSPTLYQDILPTEIWRLILDYLPTLDLFSLYSTSIYMRALAAPLLVQAVANKSVCLYLYQEYVRRVGIKFVFDHFDLARDRVVFRPEVTDNQYRFRSGLTLQNPQLEEIAVTTSGRAIRPHQVQQSGGRYFTVQRIARTGKQTPSKAQSTPSPASASSTSTLPASVIPGPPSLATAVSATVTETTEPAISAPRKRTTDEKVYHGAKNFLDKTCPVHVRRSGIRQVDGTRHSFLQDYPWAMHYQVNHEQLASTTDDSTDKSNRNPFFFNVRQHIYHGPVQATGQDGGALEAGNQTVTSFGDGRAHISPIDNSKESTGSCDLNSSVGQAVSSKQSNSSASGPRYLRFLMFECSMKFLDPKRATRNIIGRWIEGKVQRWKKVLGGMRQAAHGSQQHSVMASPLQGDGFNRLEFKGTPHRQSSSNLIGSVDLTNPNMDPEELMDLPGSSSIGHPTQQVLRGLDPVEFRPSTVKAF
ncbi:hypothetical protein BGZ72_002702 [Mortierella alpina]|nr:hypothetical protein BGZ72_002702 [Mortierella alpina]